MGAVGLLVTGVLNLLGNIVSLYFLLRSCALTLMCLQSSGLGFDGLLKGIIGATGLDKIYKGLGLDKWLKELV